MTISRSPGRTHLAARDVVRRRIAAVRPYDWLEHADRAEALRWIQSGAPLFRVRSPDLPYRHLVSYVLLLDEPGRAVLLVRHRKAGLWLPAGGHVDVGEDPASTAGRELAEELGLDAAPGDLDEAVFLSANHTRGHGNHLDVSLWFVLPAGADVEPRPDWREFDELAWWPLTGTDWTDGRFDPSMARFVGKLRSLASSSGIRAPGSTAARR